MRLLLQFPLLLAIACAPACGHEHDHPHPHPAETKAPGETAHVHAEHTPLGTVEVAGFRIDVVRVAPVEPGKLADFDLDFGKATRPDTVRCWIGVESGQGSRKERFAREGETVMHGHPEAPDPLPEGSRLWIEIEVQGKAERTSIPFSKP